MIYPRFVARFFAWLGGYFWLPCPICKEHFAGFEAPLTTACVVVKEEDGDHMSYVCPKASCQEQGQKNYLDYMQRPGAGWTWHTPLGYEGVVLAGLKGTSPAAAHDEGEKK